MVSLHLLYGLAQTLSPDARLILLGDRDQLASVEAGAVLGDICGPERRRLYSAAAGKRIAEASGEAVPLLPAAQGRSAIGDCIVELTRNHRFGAASGIGKLARAIRESSPDEALSTLRGGRRGG